MSNLLLLLTLVSSRYKSARQCCIGHVCTTNTHTQADPKSVQTGLRSELLGSHSSLHSFHSTLINAKTREQKLCHLGGWNDTVESHFDISLRFPLMLTWLIFGDAHLNISLPSMCLVVIFMSWRDRRFKTLVSLPVIYSVLLRQRNNLNIYFRLSNIIIYVHT